MERTCGNGTLRKETVYEYGELDSINEYNEDGTALGSYHCLYGNVTDLETYTASEKAPCPEF